MREVAHIALIVVLVMLPLVAGGNPLPNTDPVVQDVVRLLGEGLSSELVSEWLEKTGKKPEEISAEDLITLKKAGASEALVQELVYLSGTKPEPPAPAAPAPEPVEPPSGPAKVTFTLDYEPWRGPDSGWHLFVYSNGEFLIWSPGNEEGLDLTREMEPGFYVLRFMLENHLETRSKKNPWHHEARVSLSPLELYLQPGADWKVSLEVADNSTGGALSWKVERNDEVVEEVSSRGVPFIQWPKLCEEILANIKQSKWQSSSTREAMVGCAEWESLWPGIADLPTREEVRKQLEEDKYRPIF
jgi:hypothetical protein